MVNYGEVAPLPSNDGGKRKHDLRLMLEARCQAILSEVANKRKELATSSTGERPTCDYGQVEDPNSGNDGDFRILAIRTRDIAKINEALSRLEHGTYGACEDCDEEIAEARLSALPFAVRCTDCEEKYEEATNPVKPRKIRRRWF